MVHALSFLSRAGLWGKAVCIGFPHFVLPSLLLNVCAFPVGILLEILYLLATLKLCLAPYLLIWDNSIFVSAALQGSVILTKHRLFRMIRMFFSFFWILLPVLISIGVGIMLYWESENITLPIMLILSINFLTDLLAGPYLILSLNEMAVFLHTPDPGKQNNAVPKTATGIADWL